ncbi:unnamed protein product [Acanthoscelides obtectus]|uniref:Uncharacterized protein n=1 Tax=Acanthoscelides obtectus TaxID=200917 RepID=A0A9P0LYJ9_ACAOB|nr:unnamed protein product [Acanthoscelides obtectus]CAK1675394.1 hypothetical protein AOBTE_LOCUS30195 [Acanthoscelides obtectus]
MNISCITLLYGLQIMFRGYVDSYGGLTGLFV